MRASPLERKLDYRFKNRRLLEQALVHPSYTNELPPAERSLGSYERLEFLGDAVVGLFITLELYRRYPDLSEGQLTKLRSSLVSGENLASAARRLELGNYLKLGRGEESSGGRERASNLAASLEALVGAVCLDRGFDKARKFVIDTLSPEMEILLLGGIPEDPKSRLQELLQSNGLLLPEYHVVHSGGPEHDRNFLVEVVLDGEVLGRGEGKRKLDAEKQAAQEALQHLSSTSPP